ncbi:PDR/VanB family oxidoreductase [Pseudoglutamicibacter cumminsii]|uniref:Oxidoreductase n=1 Tax=Pseudoglutamicibacter cumminsii TaxID=156979 RepID=A0ABX5L5M5_9MICC|nr:PDR/VanB family oxidoreductase [Pseudoglutamicibacter cumminsii]PWI27823.1 oxidoreductase [Pseudoglutamicibacter cumminsii]
MALIDVKVTKIVDEAPNVKSFWLERGDGTPLGPYVPGAHIDVEGPTAITRQYSLFSTPEAGDSFAIAVKREEQSRGGSEALHSLKVGDTLRISEPRNLLNIAEDASFHILIAAGIGITPMLSMARYMDVHDIPFHLHYFARSEEEASFLPLLTDRCPEKLSAHLGMARTDQDAVIKDAIEQAPEGGHVYVCGPEGFMDKVVGIAEPRVGESCVHLENFKAQEQPGASENSAFVVELEGEEYEIPADRSIVSVLEEHGVDVETSCEEGICGTCIMQVLCGEPEHRDNVLTKSEKESGELMAICVSRSKTPKLELDWD